MEYAISTWNFVQGTGSLSSFISASIDMGFNAVSFTPAQVLTMDRDASTRLGEQISAAGLSVTVHADFTSTPDEIDSIMAVFGERLRCISLDPRCRIDPAGRFFEPGRMLPLLEHLRRGSDLTGIRFGLEDFPIDRCALDRNGEALAGLLECPCFGALIDLGHMNLRLSTIPHFAEKGVDGYISGVPVPIFEVHVHDNWGEGDLHMPPGKGNLDLRAAASALRARGFQGVSTIEIAPSRYGAEPGDEYESVAFGLCSWKDALELSDG